MIFLDDKRRQGIGEHGDFSKLVKVRLVVNFPEVQVDSYVPEALSTCIPFDSANSLGIFLVAVIGQRQGEKSLGGGESHPNVPLQGLEYYMCYVKMFYRRISKAMYGKMLIIQLRGGERSML